MISNNYEIIDDVVYIFMKRRDGNILKTQVDLDTFNNKIKEMPVSWYAHFDPKMKQFYVVGYLRGTGRGSTKLKLHRVVTEASGENVVDHINHDTLDNRLENLRATSAHINQMNRNPKKSRVKHRYINYREDIGKWRVYYVKNKKFKHVGLYSSFEEAAEKARQVERMLNDYVNSK